MRQYANMNEWVFMSSVWKWRNNVSSWLEEAPLILANPENKTAAKEQLMDKWDSFVWFKYLLFEHSGEQRGGKGLQ